MITTLRSWLPRVHSDNRGDIPVSTILIIGAIVLPLLFFLIGYKNQISDFVNKRSQEVMATDETNAADGGFK